MSKAVFENAECVHATEKAIQVQLEDREEPIWIPQSLVDDDSEVYRKGDKGRLVVPEWWAIDKKLL